MGWKTVALLVALLLEVAVFGLGAPVVLLVIDEAAVPPASAAPDLPAPVTATHRGVKCGSGGCWREWTLRGPEGTSGTELADSLDLADERCSARSLLDRRVVCTWVDGGREARLFVRYDRPLT